MKISILTLVAIIFAMIHGSPTLAQNHNLITNWQYTITAPPGRSPGVGNPMPFPDAIHPNSLVAGVGYGVVRLDPGGKELFNFKVAENVMVPAIGDLNGDKQIEIVVPTNTGAIYCINENGKQLWKKELNDFLYDYGSAVLADIDGDGKLESFFNAKAGTIYCLNFDGSLRWKVLAEPRACNPAVGDIDGDGKAEIFFGTDVSKIFCLDYQGKYLWHTEILNGVYGRSSPTLADLNGDGRYELVMPHSNTTPYPAIVVLDAHSGKVLWKGATVMQNYGGTSIADLDHDDKLEIVVVDKGNTVNVFGWDGKLKWRTTLSGHGMFFAAGIADFFNDGHYEILCGCRATGPEGQTMFLLSDQGKIICEFKEGGDRQTTPVIADLNGDKIPEICCSDVARKNIVSYTLQGTKAGGDIPWPCWKKDPANNSFMRSPAGTRFPVETIPGNKSADSKPLSAFIGRNTLKVELPLSLKASELICEARITDGGKVVHSTFTWETNSERVAEIPFNVTVAEVQELEYIIRDRNSKDVLIRKSVKVSAAGYVKDREYVKSSVSEMQEITGKLSSPDFSLSNALASETANAKALLASLSEDKNLQKPGIADKTIENNRERMDVLLKYARFLSKIRQNGSVGSFYVWQNPNPWDATGPENAFPVNPCADTIKVPVLAMGNETESVALDITNLKESSQVVKVYPCNLEDSRGKQISFRGIVELREAINTPDNRGKMTDEVLPKLNEGNTIYLGGYDSRKLWININTSALSPGNYSFRLGFESVSLVESTQSIVINLRVSPVRVPDKNEYAFNTWSSVEIADDFMREKVVKDLIDHKIGVFSMLPGPRFYLGSNGKLCEDWSHWDKYYTPLKDKIICFVTSALSVETNGQQVNREEYASLLKEAYTMAHKGMAARGLDKKQWAIYVMDEPALTGYPSIELAVRIAKEIRAASPDMELYIDPAGMVTPESMKPFEGLIDIYSPQIDLLKDPDGKLLNYFQQLNKRLWTYEAPSPARTFHPLGHYRVQAWLAFEYGLTGSGFWCYNSNNVNNLWRVNAPDDYDAVYNDGTGIIPSRRWEASRDGVEDYHLLMMLKRKIAELKDGSGQQKALALEAEDKMQEIVRNITSKVKKIKEINRDFIPYEIDYCLFTEGRKALIGYLEKMNQKTSNDNKN